MGVDGGESGRGGKRRARRRWRWVLELAVILAVVVGIQAYRQRDTASGMAPPLTGRLLSGQRVSLAALHGRPVLVHFWATWCPVCRLEQGSIAAIARDHAVLTVAFQDGSAERVRAYMRREGLNYPVLADPDGVLASRYGVRAVPTSFIVGPRGRIRFVEVGYTSEAGLRLRLWLAARLPHGDDADTMHRHDHSAVGAGIRGGRTGGG
ncbi:MAG TPA: protein disulfide oxidoreductase [Gammaproteobacteria bacterium]|nr:protein disulfide oxidoreductase [Gammaproteobacteria bacterium]